MKQPCLSQHNTRDKNNLRRATRWRASLSTDRLKPFGGKWLGEFRWWMFHGGSDEPVDRLQACVDAALEIAQQTFPKGYPRCTAHAYALTRP